MGACSAACRAGYAASSTTQCLRTALLDAVLATTVGLAGHPVGRYERIGRYPRRWLALHAFLRDARVHCICALPTVCASSNSINPPDAASPKAVCMCGRHGQSLGCLEAFSGEDLLQARSASGPFPFVAHATLVQMLEGPGLRDGVPHKKPLLPAPHQPGDRQRCATLTPLPPPTLRRALCPASKQPPPTRGG